VARVGSFYGPISSTWSGCWRVTEGPRVPDQAMNDRRDLVATVVSCCHNAVYRVELGIAGAVWRTPAGARVKISVRVRGRPGKVELSPHDPGRGRITKVLKD